MRIISGRHRSRQLICAVGQETRPTADRTRETIFNILLHGCLESLQGVRVLDVFAGTGALGFEALSRGAAFVAFIEKNPKALAELKKNGVLLKEESQMKGYLCDVFALPRAPAPFNLIFLDPPYHQNLIAPALEHLQKQRWIQENAWIMAEVAAGEVLALSPDYALKTRRNCGAADIHFFSYKEKMAPRDGLEPPTQWLTATCSTD